MFIEQLINGLTLGGIYALIAVGYTMVYGVIQLINFAHGEVYMLGAFLAFTFLSVWHLPFFLAFGLSLVSCALLGVLIELVAYRPLRRAPRLSALITAIGVSLFLQNLAMLIWGANNRPFPQEAIPSYLGQTAFTLSTYGVSWLQVLIYGVALVAMGLLHLIIHHTKVGMAMRACAQDRIMAGLVGVNTNRVISLTFAIGSTLGAAAGILVGLYYNVIFPTMGYMAGIKAFAAAVLGGIGHVPGAMLGGLILGVGEAFGAAYLSSLYRHGIAYAVMIAVILFRPSGLLGSVTPPRR